MRCATGIRFVLLLFVVCLAAGVAHAEEKMIGVVEEIFLAADGASARVILTDNKTDEAVEVLIRDDLTLEKLKDNRIVPDDEVRVKYEMEGDAKVASYFRKTAGC